MRRCETTSAYAAHARCSTQDSDQAVTAGFPKQSSSPTIGVRNY
jgi:hypothetical protein